MAVNRSTVRVAVVFILTCAVFLPSLRCGFIWDDNSHVTRPELRTLHGLYRIWFQVGATQQYYPLLHSAFWIEQKLWGERVWAYHLINVLQHAAAACLVYLILQRLQVAGSLLAALLFALHPVQVESVVWISEQKNTLSALFYLGAMLTYLRFDQSRSASQYLLASVLFLLGLLTKTVIATLPAALLVIFWWQRGRLLWRRDVLPLLPWFAFGAAAGLFTAWVEHELIGAEGATFEMSLVQRFLLAGRAIWFYLANLLWPNNLVFFYPHWEIDPTDYWQWIFPVGAIFVSIGFWLLRQWSRGPLACWLFFVGTLFPALGFFNVYPFMYSYVADHFQYLASLGMFVLAAGAGTAFVDSLSVPWRRFAVAAEIGLVAILTIITWQQIPVYTDRITLFKHTVAGNPSCWMAYTNLGYQLLRQGDIDGAAEQLRVSFQLNSNHAPTRVNLGMVAEKRGKLAEAIEWYESAIVKDPEYFLAHFHLGQSLDMAGRPAEAIPHYREAIRIWPEFSEAHSSLGVALGELNQNGKSLEELNIALQLNPQNSHTQHNMAFLLTRLGRVDEAEQHYREALRLRPNFPLALFNWANAIAEQRPLEAIEHYSAAIEQQPDYAEAYVNLAAALAKIGNRPKALEATQKAIELARAQHKESLVRQLEPYLRSYEGE